MSLLIFGTTRYSRLALHFYSPNPKAGISTGKLYLEPKLDVLFAAGVSNPLSGCCEWMWMSSILSHHHRVLPQLLPFPIFVPFWQFAAPRASRRGAPHVAARGRQTPVAGTQGPPRGAPLGAWVPPTRAAQGTGAEALRVAVARAPGRSQASGGPGCQTAGAVAADAQTLSLPQSPPRARPGKRAASVGLLASTRTSLQLPAGCAEGQRPEEALGKGRERSGGRKTAQLTRRRRWKETKPEGDPEAPRPVLGTSESPGRWEEDNREGKEHFFSWPEFYLRPEHPVIGAERGSVLSLIPRWLRSPPRGTNLKAPARET